MIFRKHRPLGYGFLKVCFFNMQLLIFFYLTITCFFLALFFLLARQFTAEKYCSKAGCAFCALTLATLLIAKGNLPIFKDFESLIFITCILGTLVLFCSPRHGSGTSVRFWGYGFILGLLLLSLCYPKGPSPDGYIQHYIWSIFFLCFRQVALAAMLFSSCFFIQYRKDQRLEIKNPISSHPGRNYMLLSAVCFLISEYAGMIWCQKGWGDFWQWSNGFFQSTLVLLYLMTAFHIPGRNGNFDRARSLIGSLSGIFFLTMTMLRSLI